MIEKLELSHYPPTLQHIHKPPPFLYMRGRLPDPATHKYLCVIGSRAFSSYGEDACRTLIHGLAGYPISIVSGLALGIDSIAHEAALAAGLHTTSFPGSRLDRESIYPREKAALADQILLSGGALLSECGPDDIPGTWLFPRRNRYMAGISHATLIIEARQHSGTLMTADYSLEESRDVFVVPGPIFSEHSYGPHMLLRRGATVVSSSEEILESLGFIIPEQKGKQKGKRTLSRKEKKLRAEERQRVYAALSPTERQIMDFASSTVVRERLIEKLGLPITEANIILAGLELRGLIHERGDTVVRT